MLLDALKHCYASTTVTELPKQSFDIFFAPIEYVATFFCLRHPV